MIKLTFLSNKNKALVLKINIIIDRELPDQKRKNVYISNMDMCRKVGEFGFTVDDEID